MKNSNIQAFIELVRAGLWEKEARLLQFDSIDFSAIYKLAEEQSVVGLCAAGLEHVFDMKIPQDVALLFAGTTLQLEQRNYEMNSFLGSLYGQLQREGIYAILVKGQGIAQCYERPLWRAAGDIDLLLSDSNYNYAKERFDSYGKIIEDEHEYRKRVEYLVDSWYVELHGTMRGELGHRIDKVIDEVQNDVFFGENVRSWMNGKTTVFLPSPDNDVIFVFAHILQHFFRGGIGLRQICDWCRLLWIFRDRIDSRLLEKRLRLMGVISEWHAFASLAVDLLGMPAEAMPFYSPTDKWKTKSQLIIRYIIKVGNFGYNRDLTYKARYPFFKRIIKSLQYRTDDFLNQVRVFPLDAVRAYLLLWKNGFDYVKKEVL